MSPNSSAPGSAPFSIAGVIVDSLRVYGRNAVGFLLLGVALRAVWLVAAVPTSGADAPTWADWPSQIGNPLLRLGLAGIAQMLLAFVTLRTLQGGKATFADAIKGLKEIGAVIVVTLICFLPQALSFAVDVTVPPKSMTGAGVGLAVSVIGLVVVVLWWLAVSVVTIERKGAIAGLARCARLTAGRRWLVLGITAVIGLVFAGGGYLATHVLGLSAAEAAAPVPTSFGRAIWFLITAFLAALLASMATVTYYRLRLEKEGAAFPDIA